MVKLTVGETYYHSDKTGTNKFGRVCEVTQIDGDQVTVRYIADSSESMMHRNATQYFEAYDREKVESDRDFLRRILGNFEAFLQK